MTRLEDARCDVVFASTRACVTSITAGSGPESRGVVDFPVLSVVSLT